MELNKITRFLDKELRIRKIKDASKNGLQVKCGSQVKKVGFAVDACLSTFEKAKKENVDLLIVHHGIKWKPQKYKDITNQRESYLKKNNISLYAAHLPLDCHNKYGNNIGLAKILNLKDIRKFGIYHGSKIGYSGKFQKPVTLSYIASILNKELKTKCIYLSYKNKIKTIGIVSGGGADVSEDAIKNRLDCFLVGEMDHGDYCRITDCKLSTIIAGHYHTEIVGVKLLMPLIKQKFGVETVFLDNPPKFKG